LANAAADDAAAKFNAAARTEVSKAAAEAINATSTAMLDQSMKIAVANADANTRIELQNIDAGTRKDLANIEAKYKNQMQASASANEIFQQATKNIADIMSNPDLDTAAKNAAVAKQKGWLEGAMSVLSATSEIPNLKNLITFS